MWAKKIFSICTSSKYPNGKIFTILLSQEIIPCFAKLSIINKKHLGVFYFGFYFFNFYTM